MRPLTSALSEEHLKQPARPAVGVVVWQSVAAPLLKCDPLGGLPSTMPSRRNGINHVD